MKFSFLLIIYVTAVGVISGCNANDGREKMDVVTPLEAIHFDKMLDLSYWFIEKGLGEYYEKKEDAVYERKENDPPWAIRYADTLWIQEYVESNGYFLYKYPEIEKNNFIAQFNPYINGLRTKTECFYRIFYEDKVYEYWIIKQWKYQNDYKRLRFIVAESDFIGGVRKIVFESDRFFDSYGFSSGYTLVFPKNDLSVLYRLKAWLFPEFFRDSGLESLKIINYEKGKYRKQLVTRKLG